MGKQLMIVLLHHPLNVIDLLALFPHELKVTFVNADKILQTLVFSSVMICTGQYWKPRETYWKGKRG
jgi:hypothetical protein